MVDDFKDYYLILGVFPTSDAVTLDTVYRDKVKTYHPDVYSGDKQFAEEEIKKINEAYGVLKDPIKREEYDQVWTKKNSNTLVNIKQEDDIKKEQLAKEKEEIILKRRRQLDNQIMGWCVFCIVVIIGLTMYFRR